MKTKLLLYCTQGKKEFLKEEMCPILEMDYDDENMSYIINAKKTYIVEDYYDEEYEKPPLNGKIVAECECEVEEIINYGSCFRVGDLAHTNEVARESCLYFEDMHNYLGTNNGYALHLTNIKAFEKPLELGEVDKFEKGERFSAYIPLTKSPQNMMWVWLNGEMYCLISIRPEWICKIANGEKTIEVRRKILKGML